MSKALELIRSLFQVLSLSTVRNWQIVIIFAFMRLLPPLHQLEGLPLKVEGQIADWITQQQRNVLTRLQNSDAATAFSKQEKAGTLKVHQALGTGSFGRVVVRARDYLHPKSI